MKAARNYKLGAGGGTIPQPTLGAILKIKLNVTGASPVINFADFKYNKDVAFGLGFDDGLITHYNHVFPFFIGGVSKTNGQTYPGLLYNDGTGRMIPFHASMVVPAGGVREIDGESNAASLSWAKLKEMVDAGFSVNNHSENHGGGADYWNRLGDIKRSEQEFYDKAGIRPLVGTTPASERGFMYSFRNLGYLSHNSTFNEGNSDITVYGKMRPTNVPVGFFNLDRASSGDNFTAPEAAGLKGYIDEIYNDCDNGGKMFGNFFTHGPGNIANFNDVYSYILTHPKNTNQARVWVPSLQEYLEYFHVKRKTVVTQERVGNELTITLDQSAVAPNIRCRDMSLLLSGVTVNSIVNVEGGQEVRFNASTGLVNVFNFDKSKVINPALDVHPAQLVSVVAAGNTVNLTFDKVVNQSLKDAYSIAGKTVVSLTGGGKSWVVTFNSAIAPGNLLTYESNKGNAISTEAGALKVCDYINFPID